MMIISIMIIMIIEMPSMTMVVYNNDNDHVISKGGDGYQDDYGGEIGYEDIADDD